MNLPTQNKNYPEGTSLAQKLLNILMVSEINAKKYKEAKMFKDSFIVREKNMGTKVWVFPLSLAVHMLIVLLLIIYPLLNPSNLPKIEIFSAFLAPPPPPPQAAPAGKRPAKGQAKPGGPQPAADYLTNIAIENTAMQQDSDSMIQELFQQDQQGVQVQKAE